MQNPNQHITEFLNYYCGFPTAPQYAVMLKGKWGSGKTHFINEYRDILDAQKKKYIYVSLYGVSSYDEIETKFLEVLHPKLYNKKTILAGKIAKGLLRATLKVDLDGDGKANGTVSGQIPNIDMKDLLNTQDRILIFDDLERCSIDINDLLGYINYFVEHQEYRVILLANEEELEKDKKYKFKKYKLIKEKLIGKTFELLSNTELAYDSFIREIDNEVFEQYKSMIIKIYKQSKYDNLRVLRQVILDFNRFYNIIELNEFKEELVKDLIEIFFILSIQSRLSDVTICELKLLKDEYSVLIWKDDKVSQKKKKNNEFKKFELKYDLSYKNDYIFSFEIWSQILEESIISDSVLKKILFESKYYINENSPNWKRLSLFESLKDDEFVKVLELVEVDMRENKYRDLQDVLVISTLLLELKEKNLYNKEKEDILKLIYNHIDFLFENDFVSEEILNTIARTRRRSAHKFDNVIYEYKERKRLELEKKVMKIDSFKIIEYLKNKDYELLELIGNHNSNSKYHNKAILIDIDMEKLIEVLLINESDSCYYLGYILETRYEYDNFNNEIMEELDFLLKLKERIKIEIEVKKGKVSGYNLNKYLIKQLTKAINDLTIYIEKSKDKS